MHDLKSQKEKRIQPGQKTNIVKNVAEKKYID
jgi:hypothetical protein